MWLSDLEEAVAAIREYHPRNCCFISVSPCYHGILFKTTWYTIIKYDFTTGEVTENNV